MKHDQCERTNPNLLLVDFSYLVVIRERERERNVSNWNWKSFSIACMLIHIHQSMATFITFPLSAWMNLSLIPYRYTWMIIFFLFHSRFIRVILKLFSQFQLNSMIIHRCVSAYVKIPTYSRISIAITKKKSNFKILSNIESGMATFFCY